MDPPGPRHAALRGTESGWLAIADISGYSAYLAGAELDHAQDVLAALTETVVRALSPPMKLSKIQGDAVFVWPSEEIWVARLSGRSTAE